MAPIKDLNNLYFFAKVVECGSYTAAARALGLQTSKLSRRIADLEAELGVRLINRTTRRLSLTDAGAIFHRHSAALVEEARVAKEAMSHILAAPQGLLRIACPTGLLQAGVADLLLDFLARYPDVRISLDATNRRVDLVHEGVDVALRVRLPPLEDSDLAMRAFGPSDIILVASPAFVAARGAPRVLDDVARAPTLSMGHGGERTVWRFTNDENQPMEVEHTPRLSTDDLHALRAATLAGLGAACLPSMFVGEDIATGELVRLMPMLRAQSGIVHAVFPSRRGMAPAMRALLDLLAEGFATRPNLISGDARASAR